MRLNQLPNELLVQIFTNVERDAALSAWRQERRLEAEVEPLRLRWQRLMLVCRHWRDVLVSTPAFWRDVHLRSRDDWMKLCLARSAPASIDVYALPGIQPHIQPHIHLATIYPHVHRFRRFHFEAVYGPHLRASLSPLFGNGMPVLEDLAFTAYRTIHESEDDIDIQLTSQRFPRLRDLGLSRIVAPRDPTLYAHLRELALYGCSHNLSFDCFLDVLAASVQLEQLHLSAALHRFSGPDDWISGGPVPRRPPISLPRLHTLELDEHGIVRTSRFLAHLHLHRCVAIVINSDFQEKDYVDNSPDTVNTVGAMLPPNHSATLPVLAAATQVCVTVWDDVYSIASGSMDVSASPREFTVLALSMSMHNSPSWDPFMAQGLDDLVDAFGRSPLTHLSVTGHHGYGTVAAWARVFRAFPLLEWLDIVGESDVSKVFLGLHAASADSPDPCVACPNLKKVKVEGEGTVAAYEAMRDCFRYRGERGVILEFLSLAFLQDAVDLTPDVRRALTSDFGDGVDCLDALPSDSENDTEEEESEDEMDESEDEMDEDEDEDGMP